jgi:hypothetical protein
MIQKKVASDSLSYIPADAGDKDFKFVLDDGSTYSGTVAITTLANRFPVVKEYVGFLPEKYQDGALKIVYNASSVVRAAIKKVGGCNCGK